MQFDSMSRVTFPTAIGDCALSWSDAGITGFELPPAALNPENEVPAPEFIADLIARVQQHMSGTLQDFSDVRFDFGRVREFHREVYYATLAVKAGQTRSYGEIANGLGCAPGMSRAVGSALGANPWPLLVPCHRIVSADGRLANAACVMPPELKFKLRLLNLEGAQLFAE